MQYSTLAEIIQQEKFIYISKERIVQKHGSIDLGKSYIAELYMPQYRLQQERLIFDKLPLKIHIYIFKYMLTERDIKMP